MLFHFKFIREDKHRRPHHHQEEATTVRQAAQATRTARRTADRRTQRPQAEIKLQPWLCLVIRCHRPGFLMVLAI